MRRRPAYMPNPYSTHSQRAGEEVAEEGEDFGSHDVIEPNERKV